MCRHYDRLGFVNPYWVLVEGKVPLFETFWDAAQRLPGRAIDPVSVIEYVNKRHVLGGRAIVQGLSKSPWMAKLNGEGDGWEYASVREHGDRVLSGAEIAAELLWALEDEIVEVCKGLSTVGILLSGGMDGNEVRWLGITISSSYLGGPACNGVIERFNRTLKEQCVYLHRFESLEQTRAIIAAFIERDSREWLIERLGHRTRPQARADALGRAA